MSIPVETAKLVDTLHTDELEILCGLNVGEHKAALETRLYCQLELIDRYETGLYHTPLNKRKADKWRFSAKELIKNNACLPLPHNDAPRDLAKEKQDKNSYNQLHHFFSTEKLDIQTGDTNVFFGTDWFYWFASYYTRSRLFLLRANKVFSNFKKSFLGDFYVFAGFFGIIEFVFDFSIVVLGTLFDKTRAEADKNYLKAWARYKTSLFSTNKDQLNELEKELKRYDYTPSRWQRFLDKFNSEGRIGRMLNGILWFAINFVGWFLSGGSFGLFIVILNIFGAAMDICNDTGMALYHRNKHQSLLNKLAANKDKNASLLDTSIRGKSAKELNTKIHTLSIQRVGRLFVYNTILSVALILFQPIAWPMTIAAGLLSAITVFACADLAFHMTLPSHDARSAEHQKNRIDKIRGFLVLLILIPALAGIAAMILFPPSALVFTLPLLGTASLSLNLIGSAIALWVGATGIFRAVAFSIIDKKWTQDRLNVVYDKVIAPTLNFFRGLFQQPANKRAPVAIISLEDKQPLLGGDPNAPFAPGETPIPNNETEEEEPTIESSQDLLKSQPLRNIQSNSSFTTDASSNMHSRTPSFILESGVRISTSSLANSNALDSVASSPSAAKFVEPAPVPHATPSPRKTRSSAMLHPPKEAKTFESSPNRIHRAQSYPAFFNSNYHAPNKVKTTTQEAATKNARIDLRKRVEIKPIANEKPSDKARGPRRSINELKLSHTIKRINAWSNSEQTVADTANSPAQGRK